MLARRSLIAAGLVGLACLVACQSGTDATTTLTLEIDSTDPDTQQRAAEVVRGRLEQRGVRGLVVGTEGSDRVVVSFRGDGSAKKLGELVCRTATVEFQMVRPPEDWRPVLEKVDEVCRVRDPEGPNFSQLVMPGLAPESAMLVLDANVERVGELINDPHVQRAMGGVVMRLGRTPRFQDDGVQMHSLYLLDDRELLTGREIDRAVASPDPNRPGPWQIDIEFTAAGARDLAKLTGDNAGGCLAICLNGEVVSAPRIQGAIPGGKAVIQGMFDREEASELALLMTSGGLPTTIRLVNVQVD